MEPKQVEDFVRRGWAAAAAAKRAYWGERYATGGWRAAWDAAQALLMHVRTVQPDFPSERDRARDVVAIVAAKPDALDIRYVRDTLTMLERALAQSDLLPALDAALTRAQRPEPPDLPNSSLT